jgi:hypothetical protein
MGESWLTEVRGPLIREEWGLRQGQERDKQGRGQHNRSCLAARKIWKQEGERISVVAKEAGE